MKKLFATFVLFISLTSFSHEGHDKAPGTLSAPHGGQLKGTSQLYVELVSDTNGFKIYTIDHELQAIPLKDVKIEVALKLPKQKQSEKISLNLSESFAEGKVNVKGAHRYIIDLKVTYKGKTESLSFNVESQE